ncbi:MAG: RelA/SpoT family protein [Marinifilaceae bacterium]|jgi:GTP pyrophosphokinase|nr:RelA/SpoT family protein [Marinifilaceae bacterium]
MITEMITENTVDIERRVILNEYKNLLKTCRNIITQDDIKLVRKAFELSLNDKEGLRNHMGEPEIYRTLNIAKIVVEELGLGRTSVTCALLYEMVQKKRLSIEKVESLFGLKVAQIIQGLVKVTDVYNENPTKHTENFRKLLLSFADDVRVVLIILADRLYHLRNLENKDSDYQLKLCEEIEFLYIPLAHRLGMYHVKSDMEDLALKFTDPRSYYHIKKKLEESEQDRQDYVQTFIKPIVQNLDKMGIKYKIKARTKTIASILNKMKKKQVEFEEVYDIFAIRIIIKTSLKKEKTVCWRAYSAITDLYRPNPERLRDWISIPKSNGYESLHTTVMGPEKKWVEIQIRTKRMNKIAEQGFAAHWKYKGGKSEGGLDNWLNDIRGVLESEENSSIDLIDKFKSDLYNKEIYVFTPNGDLIKLPLGACLLDFAYSIHSDLGDKCIGGSINQKNASIRKKLKNGDTVSVSTSANQKPKQDWLSFVVSTKAKNKIRQSLNEEMVKVGELGKEALKRRMKNWKLDFNDANLRKLLNHYKYKLAIDLYYDIAIEEIDLSDIKEVLVEEEESKKEINTIQKEPHTNSKKNIKEDDVLIVSKELDNVDYSMAKCCNPVYGDDIFGFITIGKGIKIHRQNCTNAKDMKARYPYRLVSAAWSGKGSSSYETILLVSGIDQIGIMTNISMVISKDLKVQMKSLNLNTNSGSFEGEITVMVTDLTHLDFLIEKLKKINGVLKIVRKDSRLS